MALSQIQCLDDNHINPRTTESKPEFLYSEDQRLAIEALLGDGRDAFVKYLEARGLRGFLSDLEQEALTGLVEPFDPGSEVFPEGADENEPPLSLHYWPELSDTSIPLMDLGWPDSDAYRGVTRTTVYTQPPLEGQTHVKEIVRKMIAQAQKVIAVVMDVFTDVDIFRDLLDASFKRRVSVYILLEHTMLPHFLSMCRRANMHAGHLKHLRVRFTEGTEFHTRSCTKVKGRMGHRFMFVDGDKALSGSYSFTWMSSRLDRNLVTVITGQAVDAFDRLFRCLYMDSRFVDLRQVAVAPEPEPEPIQQPVSVPLPSAALARKLHNPKYALVAVGNPSPASTPSPGNNSPKDSQTPDEPENKKRRRRRSLEAQEAPPLHPGLVNLEKAALIAYLPTWPEPDPPSDVIGFINIRDSNKPSPVHLQRSEMFGTSQAIRFSSPISAPKETLPEVAKLRQQAAETKVGSERQPTQEKSKTEEPTRPLNGPADVAIKNKEAEPKPAASALKSAPTPVKNNTEALNTQHSLNSNKPDTRPPLLSGSKPPTPNTESPSDAAQTVSTNKPASLPAADAGEEAQTKASVNTKQRATTENRNHTLESKNTHLSADSTPSSAAATQPLPVSSARDILVATAQHSAPPASVPKHNTTSPYMSLMASPPVPKPRTIHLIGKDKDPLKVQQPDNPENGARIMQGDPAGIRETQQRETPAKIEVAEAAGSHQGKMGTQADPAAVPQTRSDVLIASRPKAERMHIQEELSKEAEREALMPGDRREAPKPQTEPAHTEKTETRADCEIAKVPNLIRKNVTQSKSHCEEPNEAQRASRREGDPPIAGLDPPKAEVKDGVDVEDGCAPSPANNNTQGIPEEQQASTRTPPTQRPMRLPLSDSNAPELRSPTPEKESRLLIALMRSPTPDGLPQRTPTPDFRTPTPDFRSSTPDFRTPTPLSDGYTSSRDSPLSTTSDEFYECCDAPVLEQEGRVNPAARSPGLSSSTATERKVKMKKEDAKQGEGGKPSDEGRNPGVAEEKKPAENHGDATEVAGDGGKQTAEDSAQTPRKKKAASKPAADGGSAPAESATKEAELKRPLTSNPKAEETGVSKKFPGPPNEERSASRDAGGHTQQPPHQQGVMVFQSARQPQQPMAQRFPSAAQLAGARSWVNKAEGKVHHSSTPVLDYTSRKAPPSRPGAPHATAAHKQAAPLSRQPTAAAQVRARGGTGGTQDQPSYPKPPTAFLQQRGPPAQNHAASAQEAHRQEEGRVPFSFSFSRLYNLKGLKDKIGKMPAQGKRSSTGSPAQNHHHHPHHHSSS